MSLYVKYPSNLYNGPGVAVYANLAAFPPSAPAGTLAVAADTDILYEYSVNATAWQPIASNVAYEDAIAAPSSIGALDSQPENANGLALAGGVLSTQSADATHPGMVNNTTQTFSGDKTFADTTQSTNKDTGAVVVEGGVGVEKNINAGGNIAATGTVTGSNLSGTNTGDVTLTAVGSSPNSNSASLSGQALTIQPADGTNPGVLTAGVQTIGGNKTLTGTIAASNFSGSSSGSNTGDVTLAAVGSSPSANGASLSGQVLTLQPADATNPGLITTGTQTFAGTKNFSTPIPYPSLGSLPVHQIWYVDGTRVDSYTADGSEARPYKTIMAAVNAIIATGLNSSGHPDVIYIVGPGVYAETVTLNSTALYNITIEGNGFSSCTAISSTTNNGNLMNLYINNMTLGVLTLTGATNGTTFLANDANANMCFFSDSVAITNAGSFIVYNSKISNNLTFSNINSGGMVGGDGMNPGGSFTVATTGGNAPSGFGGTSIICEKTLIGLPTLSAGATLQLREGCRVGFSGGSSTISGDLVDYGVVYRTDLTFASGSTWTTRGSTTVGTITNSGTITRGSIFQGDIQGNAANVTGVVDVANGGTGATSFNNHGVLIGQGSGAVVASGTGATGKALISNGISADPTYQTLTTAGGGTGVTTLTAHGVVLGQGASSLTATAAGTAGQPLLSGGASANPDYGTLSISFGGTGQTTKAAAFDALSPMTTSGDIIYGGASGTGTRLAKGSDGQVLTLASGIPSWAPASGTGTVTSVTFTGDGTVLSSTPSAAVTTSGTVTAALNTQTARTFLSGPLSGSAAAPTFKALTAPTVQKFLSTGTTTGYLFTVTSANATVGATYTNNGNTYTVLSTISSGTQLFTSQASAPQSSGTLTKATGTGDATITFSVAAALATYTAPTSPPPLYLKTRIVGAGGAGAGGGSGSPGNGNDGTTTAFGASLLIANGGAHGGNLSGAGGVGGTASLASPAVGTALAGGSGAGAYGSVVVTSGLGGSGASSPFGGQGGGAQIGVNNGQSAIANTGSGGGGGGSNGTGQQGGGGGGAGGFVDAIIPSPSATYVYVIGVGGTGGAAGTSGGTGGNGGDGYIEVTEYYQ